MNVTADRCAAAPVKLRYLRELRLSAKVDGRDYFHAASGLVLCAGILHVVSDDSNFVASFTLTGSAPGEAIPLLSRNALPSDPIARKQVKPDFEALMELPAGEGLPHGGLLALGSGSTTARTSGAIVALDRDGLLLSATEVDLEKSLYRALRGRFRQVNIEGGVCRAGKLLLFHRGNARDRTSTVVTFDAPDLATSLRNGHVLTPTAYNTLDLGSIAGVPLTFTDATSLDDGILFVATAESTFNAYDDGKVLGSVLGLLSPSFEIVSFWRLEPAIKFEGVTAARRGGGIEVLVVSDADDQAVPSMLFAGFIPVA